jgi:hypothetical protein
VQQSWKRPSRRPINYVLASELQAHVAKTEEELRDLRAAHELVVRMKKKRAREEAFAEAREACDSAALLPAADELVGLHKMNPVDPPSRCLCLT